LQGLKEVNEKKGRMDINTKRSHVKYGRERKRDE